MGQPVVHFEVVGTEPEKLREFYGELFDWEFDTGAPVSDAVSEPGNYGFVVIGQFTDPEGNLIGVAGGA